jgi:hypothetical protein
VDELILSRRGENLGRHVFILSFIISDAKPNSVLPVLEGCAARLPVCEGNKGRAPSDDHSSLGYVDPPSMFNGAASLEEEK